MAALDLSTALRAIGQDLQIRGIQCFDLRREGKDYELQGGYQKPPAAMPVRLYYSPEDIARLDAEGKRQRRDAESEGDFFTLSHLLRGIGWYLAKRRVALMRITNNESAGSDPMYRIEYENELRERVVEDRPVSSLYEMCVSMYKQRGKRCRWAGGIGRWRA